LKFFVFKIFCIWNFCVENKNFSWF
jgi:hypothetical protein